MEVDEPESVNLDAPGVSAKVEISTPLEQVALLQKEVDRLKRLMKKQGLKWRREKLSFLRQLKAARKNSAALDNLTKSGVLSKRQVRCAANGRRIRWSAKDISKALGLRCISTKAYRYVRKVLRLPLPSISTLSRRTRSFSIAPGIMDAAAAVLEANARGMSDLERLCVVSFDEMSLDARHCYDGAADQLLSASKLQVRETICLFHLGC